MKANIWTTILIECVLKLLKINSYVILKVRENVIAARHVPNFYDVIEVLRINVPKHIFDACSNCDNSFNFSLKTINMEYKSLLLDLSHRIKYRPILI